MREYISPYFKSRILEVGVETGEFELASGKKSNKKFDFDNIRGRLFSISADAVAECVYDNLREDEPDTIVSVATGAKVLGNSLESLLRRRYSMRVRHVPSFKDGNGGFYLPQYEWQDKRVVLVDDVYTTGKSLEAVKSEVEQYNGRHELNPSDIGAEVIGAAVLLNRSDTELPLLSGGEPVYSAIRERIE